MLNGFHKSRYRSLLKACQPGHQVTAAEGGHKLRKYATGVLEATLTIPVGGLCFFTPAAGCPKILILLEVQVSSETAQRWGRAQRSQLNDLRWITNFSVGGAHAKQPFVMPMLFQTDGQSPPKVERPVLIKCQLYLPVWVSVFKSVVTVTEPFWGFSIMQKAHM